MNICDDCGYLYPGDPWYTFPPDACRTDDGAYLILHGERCTGNLCHKCIDHPDDPNDPRWVIDTLDKVEEAYVLWDLT